MLTSPTRESEAMGYITLEAWRNTRNMLRPRESEAKAGLFLHFKETEQIAKQA